MAFNWKITTKNLCFVIFVSLFQTFSFSQEGPDSTFIIRQYGFASYEEDEEIRDSIGKIWNIDYQLVAGCVVTEEFEDSIRVLNNRTKKNLVLKYGEDWEEQFFAEVDAANDKLEYDRENVIFIKDTIENENFNIEYTRNYYGSKKWFTLYSKKGISSSQFNVQKRDKSPANILFRGFDNILLIEFSFKKDTTKYSLKYEGVAIRSIDFIDSNRILIVNIWPGPSKTAEIELKNDFGLDTTLVFTIVNFPKPVLYLNNVEDGNKINKKETFFELKIDTPVPYKDCFSYEIISWQLNSKTEKKLSGKGSKLNKETLDHIHNLKKGSLINFNCMVKNPQGVIQSVSGEFIIQ
jgi:hypothetical protein